MSERISHTPGVCGGRACIRQTRLTVERINAFRRKGLSDEQLREAYPWLEQADIDAAHEYERTDMIERIQGAIKEVFGDLLGKDTDRVIEESVWEGDPYGWSDGAIATISTEHGLPSDAYDMWAVEKWCEVNDLLEDCFTEAVNGGVRAVHRC